MDKIIEKNVYDVDYWHQYYAVLNPKQPNEIVVCAESMYKNKIIDWSAYKGRGNLEKPEDVIHVAKNGDKIFEREARELFPDQQGIWRD